MDRVWSLVDSELIRLSLLIFTLSTAAASGRVGSN